VTVILGFGFGQNGHPIEEILEHILLPLGYLVRQIVPINSLTHLVQQVRMRVNPQPLTELEQFILNLRRQKSDLASF